MLFKTYRLEETVMKKKRQLNSKKEHFEDILRPNKYLGYDYDNIGICTFNERAFGIAEAEFRRAIWLNPFEPKFKVHLAWCLYAMKKFKEARDLILESLKQDSRNKKALELLKLIKEHLKDK
jgi:Tfp pilus assembly protein PilF